MLRVLVYDLETTSADPEQCYVLQIAACVLDAEDDDLPIMDNGVFSSFCKPDLTLEEINNPAIVQEGALRKNNIKREDIQGFPDEKIVWKNFETFCLSLRADGEMLIPAGWNILNFDNIITARMNEKYKSKRFFHESNFIDLMNIDWIFRQRSPNYGGKSLDSARAWFGMTLDEGEMTHDARTDIRQSAILLRRYLQFMWRQARRNQYFHNAFAKEKDD